MKHAFHFEGRISSSKSIYNRLLICKSYFPSLDVEGFSRCEDVIHLEKAISDFQQNDFFVGDGGTSFRFLALRLSRFPGKHRIILGDALQKRPHEDLFKILSQLHVKYKFLNNVLEIEGSPWYLNEEIEVTKDQSSQFLSGLLLNAWLLPEELKIHVVGKALSESYLAMTKDILNDLGMQIQWRENFIRVSPGQSLKLSSYPCEIDMSSAFVIASLGALTDGLKILDFPSQSLQGDYAFVKALNRMGVETTFHNNCLRVLPNKKWKAIDVNLSSTPDLFPVLAVLSSFAKGSSKLYGAPHLKHKESDRIHSVAKLLRAMNIKHETLADGMIIHGEEEVQLKEPTTISTFADHRVAFAAAVAKIRGYPLIIEGGDAVKKSFPDFWSHFSPDFNKEVLS